jgi:hypothetical protein
MSQNVAFEKHRFGCAHGPIRYIGKPKFSAGAKIRLHRALAIRGNQNVAACCRCAFRGFGQANIDTQRLHVMIENSAKLVVAHLADIRGRAAEVGEAGNRVGDRAS